MIYSKLFKISFVCLFIFLFAGSINAQNQTRAAAPQLAASGNSASSKNVSERSPTAAVDDDRSIIGELYSVEMSPSSSKDAPEAIIHLYNRSKMEVATLKFHSSSLGTQKSKYDSNSKIITVYYDLSMLNYFLEVLANGQKLEILHTSRSGDVTVRTIMAPIRGGVGLPNRGAAGGTKMKQFSPNRPVSKDGK